MPLNHILATVLFYQISYEIKVRISYVDPNASVESRQRELKAIWYFTCDCKRCKEQQDRVS